MRAILIVVMFGLAGCDAPMNPLPAPPPQPQPAPKMVNAPSLVREEACVTVLSEEYRQRDRAAFDKTAAYCGMSEPPPPVVPGQARRPVF